MDSSIIEFLIHISTIIVLMLPVYLSYHVLKNIGGAIGGAFKSVIAGISMVIIPHILEASEFFGINIVSGEFAYMVVQHLFLAAGFVLIGVGFYKLKNALK